MNKRESGFSAVSMMVTMLVLALIVFVVWIIARGFTPAPQTTAEPSTVSQNQTGQPAGNSPQPAATEVVRYEDDFVAFDHPKNWKVEKRYGFTDQYGAYLLDITAPVDPSLKAQASGMANLYLKASVLVTRNTRFDDPAVPCQNGSCKVYAADKVSPRQPNAGGSLVVSDWGGQGYPQIAEYTRSEVKVDDTTYTLGLPLSNTYYARIFGNYMSGVTSYIRLAGEPDFANSLSYKQLRQLVSTATFKTDKLPAGF